MPMPETAPRSVTVGDARCLGCKRPVPLKATKTGYLCYVCEKDAGGCGFQGFGRDPESNAILAGTVTKWRRPEYRAVYLDQDAEPEPPEEVPPDDPAAPPAPARAAPPRKPAPAPRRAGVAARCGTCGTVGEKGRACDACGDKV